MITRTAAAINIRIFRYLRAATPEMIHRKKDICPDSLNRADIFNFLYLFSLLNLTPEKITKRAPCGVSGGSSLSLSPGASPGSFSASHIELYSRLGIFYLSVHVRILLCNVRKSNTNSISCIIVKRSRNV